MTPGWIIFIIAFVALFLSTLTFFASRYKRCPSDAILVVYGNCGRYGTLTLPCLHVTNTDLGDRHAALNQCQRIRGRRHHNQDPLARRCGMNDVDGLLHREKPCPHAFWRRDPHRRPLARIRRNLVVNDQDEIAAHSLVPQLDILPIDKAVIDSRKENLGLSHRRPILFEARKSKTSRLQY